MSGVWPAEQFAELFHDFSADFRQPKAVDERVYERIEEYDCVAELIKTLVEGSPSSSCSERGQTPAREVADQEKYDDPHHEGRCSPVSRHVQCVSRLVLRLVGSLGLDLLSSQTTAVDLDTGDKSDQKSNCTDTNKACMPQFMVPEGWKGKEQCKCPDEGEHSTNSPGRHNLLILEVEKKSGVSVQADRCQSQEWSSGESGRGDNEWLVKWTLDKVRIGSPEKEKRSPLRLDNWTGSEIGQYQRAEQKLGRQANGRDTTHRQKNHEVGEGCSHGQWHVQSGVYKIWKWRVQTFEDCIRKRSTNQQIFVRHSEVALASWLVERKRGIVRRHIVIWSSTNWAKRSERVVSSIGRCQYRALIGSFTDPVYDAHPSP